MVPRNTKYISVEPLGSTPDFQRNNDELYSYLIFLVFVAMMLSMCVAFWRQARRDEAESKAGLETEISKY